MTTHERFTRMYQHKEADRVPMQDGPWAGTIRRWQNEGMPADVDWIEYFELDHIANVGVDVSPQFPGKLVEETEDYIICTTPWGVTLKQQKLIDSTPEFLDFCVRDVEDWKKAKERMLLTDDRVDWDNLKNNYRNWRDNGAWINANLWFGFDVTHSWFIGTETVLMAMVEEPEWCADMFNHCLDMSIANFERMLDKGYTFDSVLWYDDMGYKGTPFFSLKTYRELLKPVQKRAIEWAHSKGMKAELHSCGNILPFIPELVEIGLDGLNPIEVKAGMNPYELKQKYGDSLLFHGGLNAVLWDDIEACEVEMRKLLPIMKQNGGYIFASDHSIPSSVSLSSMKRIVELYKELGSY